jgi:hypothetical protein
MTDENKNNSNDDNFFRHLVDRIRQQPDGPTPTKACVFCGQPIKANHYFGQWVWPEDCGCGGYVHKRRQDFLAQWEQKIVERVGKRHARVKAPLKEIVGQVIHGAHPLACAVYLHGGTGSGKTQQLIEAERAINARIIHAYDDYIFESPKPHVFPPSVLTATEASILQSIKPDQPDHRQRRISDYQDCAYLFIDDMGTAKQSEWAYEQIFEIIDYRYRHEKCTLITSNIRLGKLGQGGGYDDRMTSRIFEMCGGMAARQDGTLAVVECKRNYRLEDL